MNAPPMEKGDGALKCRARFKNDDLLRPDLTGKEYIVQYNTDGTC